MTCPDHPVVVCKEDPEAADGSIAVYFSLTRLENAEASVADVVKKLAKRGRTQLMMNAHEVERDRLLPQFPAYLDQGGDNDAPPIDDDLFARRCESLYVDPNDPRTRARYHHATIESVETTETTETTVTGRAYPRDLVRETLPTA